MEDAGYFPHLQAPQTLLRLARGFSGSAPPRRLRHLEAGVALDVFDDGGQILRCRALMHRVLEHEPRRLTHPHRHAKLLALRDRQVDVLHQEFIYDAEHDHYTCPAGAKLTKIHRRADHTEDFDRYRHLSACVTCPLRPRCTPTPRRIIKRWENEDVLDRMQDRLDRMPEAMGVRRQTVEHPFGTLKAWMGATHFLTRTLDKVRTEMSLHVLAYNLKRMIRIFGVGPLMAAIRA